MNLRLLLSQATAEYLLVALLFNLYFYALGIFELFVPWAFQKFYAALVANMPFFLHLNFLCCLVN